MPAKVPVKEFDQLSSADLVNVACDAKSSSENRRLAIESLAKSDNWEGLGKALVEVTRDHNEKLCESYTADPRAFVQDIDNVQSLPIPEFLIIQELVRIGNPGALPLLRKYREDRFSLPVTSMTGEALASIDCSLKILSDMKLESSPRDEDELP